MEEDRTKITLEFDLGNNLLIGSANTNTADNPDLGRRIIDSISESFATMATAWLKDFDEQILAEDYAKAFEIFKKNQDRLQFSKSPRILESLLKMDVSKLNRDDRKEYLTFRVAYSGHIGARTSTRCDLDTLLSEYSDELDGILIQNILLEQANIAAQENLRNKASIIYKKVITYPDADPGTCAWAFQGLSLIADNEADKISFCEKAADRHLESGDRQQAIINFLSISDVKSSNDPQGALDLIDRCIALYDSESLINRELLGSLNFKKAQYLFRIGETQHAMTCAIGALELRRGLIGNEIELYSTLNLASILADTLGDTDNSQRYQDEASEVSRLINDPAFSLRLKLGNKIESNSIIDDDFFSELISSKDESLVTAALLYQSCDAGLDTEKALESLDKARLLLERGDDKQLLDSTYFAIAERYRKEGMTLEALENYKKALSYNQFLHHAAQNCVAMLFDTMHWQEAEDFLRCRIQLIGELPNICYAYGRALLENKKYALAYKYLNKSDSNTPNRQQYITDCLCNMSDTEISTLNPQLANKLPPISAEDFYKALEEFAASISSDSRMHFWSLDKESKKYKWASKPEELSKQMLITFLNGKFGRSAIEILQEPRAGAGFIDLYVLLPGGLKVVIELKMCGNGYSSNYALSGTSQIIHYQKNIGTYLGYLLVLDGRMRDFGKDFRRLQAIDNYTIYTIAADVRPQIDKD
ncbi:hypothetical protein [Stutzerimonas stutzeri]|uniref:hypothetical protein n=1 Tax=Stutzerimonas stutzeri TaxID=316 RepID=UPI00210C15C5|nr:hypothetical protein [Stutzerimonas stutzeri]MCQ4226788.1 hypothetical protein [Stutzerimonas stutzeri]